MFIVYYRDRKRHGGIGGRVPGAVLGKLMDGEMG